MDFCEGVVLFVYLQGSESPYAIAQSSRRGIGTVRFLLGDDVWNEKETPRVGSKVLLSKIRKVGDCWEAREACFLQKFV